MMVKKLLIRLVEEDKVMAEGWLEPEQLDLLRVDGCVSGVLRYLQAPELIRMSDGHVQALQRTEDGWDICVKMPGAH